MNRSIGRVGSKDKGRGRMSAAEAATGQLDGRVELIQALIPLGLEAVIALLQHDVTALAGDRYRHGSGQPGYARCGRQGGSVYLADQKLSVSVPRVRDVEQGQEVPLSAKMRATHPHGVIAMSHASFQQLAAFAYTALRSAIFFLH